MRLAHGGGHQTQANPSPLPDAPGPAATQAVNAVSSSPGKGSKGMSEVEQHLLNGLQAVTGFPHPTDLCTSLER